LGGKNALIACADAAPTDVADGVVRGMNFRYVTGQSCNSTSRVYLHDSIYDATLPAIVSAWRKSRWDCPPSATPRCRACRARPSTTRR
jgi:betaine-aldehyde dehydrogenase